MFLRIPCLTLPGTLFNYINGYILKNGSGSSSSIYYKPESCMGVENLGWSASGTSLKPVANILIKAWVLNSYICEYCMGTPYYINENKI